MKTYAVQYDDVEGKSFVLLRTDFLSEAIARAAAEKGRQAYVRHLPSGLQRYIFEGRPVWLDDHGVEHPRRATTRGEGCASCAAGRGD